jgi:hypothetical protein
LVWPLAERVSRSGLIAPAACQAVTGGDHIDPVPTPAQKKAAEAKLADGGNGVINLGSSTVPFPIPESAIEIYWNHAVRYRQHGNPVRTYTQTPVQANGKFEPVVFKETEATLKEGARHIYARRTLYVDEDTWQIAMVDVYDGRGELWRFHEGHAMVHYREKVSWLAAECQYDLLNGRYLTIGLDNQLKGYQYDFHPKGVSMTDYTPAALRRGGVADANFASGPRDLFLASV